MKFAVSIVTQFEGCIEALNMSAMVGGLSGFLYLDWTVVKPSLSSSSSALIGKILGTSIWNMLAKKVAVRDMVSAFLWRTMRPE